MYNRLNQKGKTSLMQSTKQVCVWTQQNYWDLTCITCPLKAWALSQSRPHNMWNFVLWQWKRAFGVYFYSYW